MERNDDVMQVAAAETSADAVEVLQAIDAELARARSAAAEYIAQQEKNLEVFYAWWAGQSPDGRKHRESLGMEPFPWENASDTRVRLAEEIVEDDVALMELAVSQARVRTLPVGTEDRARAGRAAKILRWAQKNLQAPDLYREVELARNWRQIHGAAVVRVLWHEEMTLEERLVTVPEVLAAAQTDDVGLVFDEGREAELLRVLEGMYPGVSAKDLRRAARELRRGGGSEPVAVVVPVVGEARVRWRALRVFEDVFFPVETEDLQRARWVAVREVLSETELHERAALEDWDPAFVEALLERGASASLAADDFSRALAVGRWRGWASAESLERPGEYEIMTVYRRAETDAGFPGIFCSVYAPALGADIAAKVDEPLPYAHGRQPFVVFQREIRERSILDSRGVPEIVLTWQNELKTGRDARIDLAELETLPPLILPASMSRQKLDFGPGARNFARDPQSAKELHVRGNHRVSLEEEAHIRRDIAWFFGRPGADVPPARQMLYQQRLVGRHLQEMRELYRLTWQVLQQYMDPLRVARVLGLDASGDQDALEAVLARSAEEIRESFDVYLHFDARDADPELFRQKQEVLTNIILPGDVTGRIDRGNLTAWQMYSLDAELAEDVVLSDEAASQKEVEDEQAALAKIYAGLEPPLREGGVNAQLRLQVIQNSLSANPQLQQRYAQDEVYRKMVDARVQHFTFLLQQRENAQIGRVGVKPVLDQ
ncbi:MAG: hypothetical protein D6781_01555 [Verrucomicrobia bacterium]|nr:MAG: hypothetical protein D6781_01555 [Verrucomicrobiota bacterium]